MERHVTQTVRLDTIIEETADTKTFRFVPDRATGTEALLPFRAGQFVALGAQLGKSFVTRPYSLSSSPADARAGFYDVTIQTGGPSMLFSHYMHTDARPGERFFLSEPTGEAYYDPERDAPLVVACAGGGGIAPYFSMARAIEAGDEDFALRLLYGSPDWDSIILRERIEAIRSPKVAVTHLLERERREGCEQGLITGARIEEAADGAPYSLYICGSDAMYEALRDAANALRNKPVRIVREPSCTANRPGPGSPCVLTLLRGGARTVIPARTDETLLVACERAGIRVPNACRAGECGWCRSRLIAGEVFLRPGSDRRTTAGRQNFVHPCCAYPCGDVELELPV